MDSLFAIMNLANSGLKAQSARLKVIAQNIANKDNTAFTLGTEPYRRKTIFLRSKFDPALKGEKVIVERYGSDNSSFKLRFDPIHPAADANGYVSYPNVDNMVEVADSKEAERSYQLNMNALSMAANMINRTISILSNK